MSAASFSLTLAANSGWVLSPVPVAVQDSNFADAQIVQSEYGRARSAASSQQND